MARGKFDDLVKSRNKGQASSQQEPVRRSAPSAGKRSDSEYKQVSAYIRKDTHFKVKLALLQESREFSELVEELLGEWVASRT
jgi:uncharacterized Zn finger protein (UPF0148 family)